MLLCAVVRLIAAGVKEETMVEPGFLMCSLSIQGEGSKGGWAGEFKKGLDEICSPTIIRNKTKKYGDDSNDVHVLL